jgi:hypothetical protein
MQEVCYCGRSGGIEDREPVLDGDGKWALRCPDCGHVDHLPWLSEEAGLLLWGDARRRRESPPEQRRAA